MKWLIQISNPVLHAGRAGKYPQRGRGELCNCKYARLHRIQHQCYLLAGWSACCH